MTNDNDALEFQEILAAIGERELTDWERERLWELLENDPSRISEYSDHCFVAAELQSLTPDQLTGSGISRGPINIVTMPVPLTHPSPRFVFRQLF